MRQLFKITSIFTLALVFTAGMAFGQTNNRAEHDQSGDDHVATSTQTGMDNTSLITQTQTNNTGRTGPGIAEADVDQTGDENFSKLQQTAFFGDHDADIEQLGDNNSSRIRTSNGGGSAHVYMEGDNNILGAFRNVGGSDGFNGVINNSPATQKNNNSLALDIIGDGNRVGAQQEFGDATISLDGDGNRLSISQKSGSVGNDASVDVVGSTNTIDVVQGSASGVGPAGNTATIDLLNGSDLNDVRVSQTSVNNTATVTVDGMNNESIVEQQP